MDKLVPKTRVQMDLTIENLSRFGIYSPPEMIWSLGIQTALKLCKKLNKFDQIDFERRRRFSNIQSEWTKKFIFNISPIMWSRWFKSIFIEKEIAIYLKPFGLLGEWLEFPGCRRFYKKVELSELAKFWEISGKVPSLLQFKLEINSTLMTNILIESICIMEVPVFSSFVPLEFKIEKATPGDPSAEFLGCRTKLPIWRGRKSLFTEKRSFQQFCIVKERMEELCWFISNCLIE